MAFTVYKSSAGSGKTYTLVREYLKIVLLEPGNYRHVLAITFTNKAANEMKGRIISTLKKISAFDPGDQGAPVKGLVDNIIEETKLEAPLLVYNAEIVLNYILHNYSDFAVSTIDSFIHRVIKSFAFDLNVPVNFEVEMDTDEVLKKVIDLMISKAGTEIELTNFLIDFVQSRANEEKNWNIESDLLKVARLLKKEDSAEFLKMNSALLLKDYAKINAAITKYVFQFESALQELGQKGKDIIDAGGVPSSAFYQGERGIYSYYNFLSIKRFDKLTPSNTVQRAVAENKWFSAKATDFDKVEIEGIKPKLVDVFEKIQDAIEKDQGDYVLFQEIRKNLHPLAILDKINQILEEFKSENNLLLISEFNQLIAEIVLDEPVPFIYERVGEKFKHFLVDEFQDTSILQWQNLLPLVDNSLASGYNNLVVGDAKQAIYRWRSGEVEQFVSLPKVFRRKDGQVHSDREKALGDHYVGKELKANYRSRPEIVKFNNDFFTHTRNILSANDFRIYDGVEQSVASAEEGGFIQIEFFSPGEEKSDFSSFNCDRIITCIQDSTAQGYRLEDIAILCRTNRSASIIAKFLLNHNIQVVSSESMLLVNAYEVRLIISALTLLVNPANHLAAIELVYLMIRLGHLSGSLDAVAWELNDKSAAEGGDVDRPAVLDYLEANGFVINPGALRALPLYDLCETLIRIFNLHEQRSPFVQFFLDIVLEQEKKVESDIPKFLEFWERKKNSLSIVVPEGIDAVKIMTIHKAKGLEFPVVIYPFVNEPLKKTADSVWIALDNDTVPDLKAALVGANKSIENSRYGEVVSREVEKSKLDMVNLLYVALTRPTDILYVIANHPDNIRNASLSVPALLVDFLNHKGAWTDGLFVYGFGEKSAAEVEETPRSVPFVLGNFTSQDWRSRALISFQAPVNWHVEEPEKRQEWGNLIHAILSEIRVKDDLDAVLDEYVFQGMINMQEQELLSVIINDFLERPGVVDFFKPGLTVYTESEIITPEGALMRPDRLVIINEQAFVIDFKTGVPLEKHRSQMLRYLQVVEQMKWKNPRGVILYLDQDEPVYID